MDKYTCISCKIF